MSEESEDLMGSEAPAPANANANANADGDGDEQHAASTEPGPEPGDRAGAEDDSSSPEGLDPEKVRGIVEAVLMTSDTPVTPGKLQALIKNVNGRDLRVAVDELNEAYQQGGHAMLITEVAGGFQVVTRKEFGPWVRKFHDRSHPRLSQAALETLAIIAFKQPVTRVEVDSVRGVDSGGVLRTLMELNMIRIVGRSEGIGRPMLFGTTRDFMTHFGLRSLADLPKPKELEELLAEGERKAHAIDGDGPNESIGKAMGEAALDDGLPTEGEPVLEDEVLVDDEVPTEDVVADNDIDPDLAPGANEAAHGDINDGR